MKKFLFTRTNALGVLLCSVLCLLWAESECRIYSISVGIPGISLHLEAAEGLVMVVVFYPQAIDRSGFWAYSEDLAPSSDRVGAETDLVSNDRHTFGPFGFGLRHEWGERFFGFWLPLWAIPLCCLAGLAFRARSMRRIAGRAQTAEMPHHPMQPT